VQWILEAAVAVECYIWQRWSQDIFSDTETFDETRAGQEDTRRAKTLRIGSRQDCDAVKVFETETLAMYSYQNIL